MKLAHFSTFFCNVFRCLNRKRRTSQRIRKLKKLDLKEKISTKKSSFKRILLVVTNEGWGDSLYVNGLAKRLYDQGIFVGLLVRGDCVFKYQGIPYYFCVFDIKDYAKVNCFEADLIVDLGFAGIPFSRERLGLIKYLKLPAVSVNSMFNELNAYSIHVDYKRYKHISERLSAVLEVITKTPQHRVLPVSWYSQKDIDWAKRFLGTNKGKKIVYLNAKARDCDRTLSIVQCKEIINTLKIFGYNLIIENSDFEWDRDNEIQLEKLPSIDFKKLSALVSMVDLVVTPDTSITHIASSANIPVFVVFPPNDRDFWFEYAAADVWRGLSDYETVYREDASDLILDCTGYPNYRPGRSDSYSPKNICIALNNFIRGLNENRRNM
jgi:hypothetical protein